MPEIVIGIDDSAGAQDALASSVSTGGNVATGVGISLSRRAQPRLTTDWSVSCRLAGAVAVLPGR